MKKGFTPSGFTLLEILVALSIFVVGMLALVTLGSQSQRLRETSVERTRAALLAQDGLETAVAAGYDQLTAGTDFLNEADLSGLGSDFSGFSRKVTVEYVDANLNLAGTDSGMKLITATVLWNETTGDQSRLTKDFTASSIITDK